MSRKKTPEEFKKQIFDLVGDSYSVLGEYINSNTKIRMKHNCEKCNNYEFEMFPNNFVRGYRCTKCSGRAKRTQKEFEQEVFDLTGDSYSVLGEYINTYTKIKIKHNVCGYEYKVKPNHFLGGRRCAKCCGNIKKTQKEFEQEIYSLTRNEYSILGEYKNSKTKIRMKHNCEKCNNFEFEMFPNNFLRGCRCPKCNSSHGEELINKFLDNRQISYQREYKFKDCRSTRPLPFDFAVFDEKGNIKLLIEYQGQQHYKNEDFFYNEDYEFVNRITIDCKKRAYCEYNNIPLLEISYTDYDNIESILIATLE